MGVTAGALPKSQMGVSIAHYNYSRTDGGHRAIPDYRLERRYTFSASMQFPTRRFQMEPSYRTMAVRFIPCLILQHDFINLLSRGRKKLFPFTPVVAIQNCTAR